MRARCWSWRFFPDAGRARDAKDAGTVNFLIESMPISLDPRIGTDAQSEHLDGLIFDSLVARDAQMNIVPDLATTWETPDPLTYVFHLRRGVKFHDGRAFTSADVKFTFDSILSGAVKSPKRGDFPDRSNPSRRRMTRRWCFICASHSRHFCGT